jgi:demethylmenaquinone methyltransferase / 2-methoxy-6-polyprenyl-1,4-benzoquinol methylase
MSSVKPYTAEGSKTTQVGKMFDNIAPYYDFLNRFLSLGIDTIWRKQAIDQLAALQPRTVLDVATGTADVAIAMSKRLKSVEKIVGFDLSKEMLEIGKTKVQARNLSNLIELQQGDSENLPFADATFDAVTVAFGVRNFENLEKGIAEMQRVLKPGGKLVVLEFSRPTIFPFKQLFNTYFKYVLPQIGRLTSKDPRAYSYLYESVQAFPDGNHFLSILSKNGFNSNEWKPLSLGICSIYCGTK